VSAAGTLPDNRRTTSADPEALIREANELLTWWGIDMSHNRVVKHVRRYAREVVGFSFFDYFANAVQADEQTRRTAVANSELAKVITYADPTGERASRNVDREATG